MILRAGAFKNLGVYGKHRDENMKKLVMILLLCGMIFAGTGLTGEIPEPILYDEEFPEPILYEDDLAPPAPPECESNFDCPSGACINGYCYVEPGCPYECCTDIDCPGMTEVCEGNKCIDVMEMECGGKTCGEDEFLNSECECTPLGGGVIDPCCGTGFALLALAGFAASRKK